MRVLAERVLMLLSSIRLLPHLFILLLSDDNGMIGSDLKRWAEIKSVPVKGVLGRVPAFVRFMTFYPEYRNVFYHRLRFYRFFLQPLCRPMSNLYINTVDIGPGLFIHHGFSTMVSARSIGSDCWINQQVSIGYSNKTDCPVIGDNVAVSAGAKIFGAVRIGDNSKIGANAVVVKDVPDNCTVVGVPARIVRRNGVRCNEEL